MPAIASLGNIRTKPPLRAREGSLLVRWLSAVSRLQLCASLTGILAIVMCIASTASVNWRVWRVENVKGIGAGKVLIGLWTVCFWKDPNDDGNSFWHCEELSEEHPTLPNEMFFAQELMSSALILSSMAAVLMSCALYNIFKSGNDQDFLLFVFKHGAYLNLPAGILVLLSVVWNMNTILENGEIHFPESFGLPQIPSEQNVGPSIYVGYIAAVFQLLSPSFVVIETFCGKTTETSQLETVVIHTAGSAIKSESQITCRKCASVLDLVAQEESCAAQMEESHSEDLVLQEESFAVEGEESHAEDVVAREESCTVEESHAEDVVQEESCAVEMEGSHAEDLVIREASCAVEESPEVPKHKIIHVILYNPE